METKTIKQKSVDQLWTSSPEAFFENATIEVPGERGRVNAWVVVAVNVSGEVHTECVLKKREVLRQIDKFASYSDEVGMIVTETISTHNLACEVSVKITGGAK